MTPTWMAVAAACYGLLFTLFALVSTQWRGLKDVLGLVALGVGGALLVFVGLFCLSTFIQLVTR